MMANLWRDDVIVLNNGINHWWSAREKEREREERERERENFLVGLLGVNGYTAKDKRYNVIKENSEKA